MVLQEQKSKLIKLIEEKPSLESEAITALALIEILEVLKRVDEKIPADPYGP